MLICLDQRTGSGCGAQNRDGAQHCSKCGMLLRFALQLQNPGAVIGHYRIVRVLGHGGFGAVYEAEDTQRPGLSVALKETFDPTSIGSYQKEFAVLRTLQHPNLPRYYEMFVYQANGYLVMELVPGQSLEDVLNSQQGQPLLESQVMGYVLQVCDALSYLHSQNPPIIHRDIKPANIRITPAGLIKLVDFGLVKQGTGMTQSSLRGAGTRAYAPIEQYGMIAGLHTDQRSDIYALGATLYHLLTGQPPLAATDRITATPDPLPHPQRVNPRISPHVASAVMTAMNLLQKDRYASTAMLKQALLGAGQLAPQPTLLPPPPANPKRPLAVTLIVALCGITGLFPWGLGIGVLIAILMWSRKVLGWRLAIPYFIVGIALGALYEIQAIHSLFNYNYSFERANVVGGCILAVVVTIGLFGFIGLFRDDVLDYFYPHYPPHLKQAERWVNLAAWWQILFGFWLIVPLVLGMGLLFRRRWALLADRVFFGLGILVTMLMFIVGLSSFLFLLQNVGGIVWPPYVWEPTLMPLAHIAFLFFGSSLFLLTRPEVDALF